MTENNQIMFTIKAFREQAANVVKAYEAAYADGNQLTEEKEIELLKEHLTFATVSTGWSTDSRFEIFGYMNDIQDKLDYSYSEYNAKIVAEYFKANRVKIIAWMAFVNQISMRSYASTSVNWKRIVIQTKNDHYRGTYDTANEQPLHIFFSKVPNIEVKVDNIKWAISTYKEVLTRCEMMASGQGLFHGTRKPIKQTGLGKLFLSKNKLTAENAENQIKAAFKAMSTNGLVSRTWGWEVEVPDAKNVQINDTSIDKGDDGSLRSYQGNTDDCECDCNDCTYHDCNCDNCEDQNDDPEHCDSSYCVQADTAEFRTIGGLQRIKHAGLFELCKMLNEAEAEKNDTAGTHIHVWAGDLTTNQVGQVMGIYKMTDHVWDTIAGRYDNQYSSRVDVGDVAQAIKQKNPTLRPEKCRAVNISQLFTERRTIEFRQLDCNLNAELITVWAWAMRGIVTCAKRGAKFHEFKNVTTLDDVIAIFAKYNFYLHDESPEERVYGTKMDKPFVKIVEHQK